MDARLTEFARLLRQNHVRVSVGEVCDAVSAVSAVGLERSDDLRAALGATLVKDAADQKVFDELFSLFFLRGADLARDLAGTPLAQLLAELGLDEDQLERVLALLGDEAAMLGATARSLAGLRGLDVPLLMRQTGAAREGLVLHSPLQIGWAAHRLLGALDLTGAERELARVVALVAGAVGEAAAVALKEAIAKNLARFRQAIRRHVQEAFEQQNADLLARLGGRGLADKPLAHLTEQEIELLRAEVRRLALKLRAAASRRPRARRRGRLDVGRTTRRSLRTGGVPFELVYRRRSPVRPRLVVLCDVSDSVRQVSRFMLELVYTLQELFAHVRSYVFVSDLGETTELFRKHDLDRAVRLAYGGAVVSVHANSNYGRAFESFAASHLAALDSRTTVIVIGDARSNYAPPGVEHLAQIRRRARRVLWLNPEQPGAWGFGDSVMREYEPHCDRVVVAWNLASLKRVLDDLVL